MKDNKDVMLAVRVERDFKEKLVKLAEYHGFSTSSLLSVLLRKWYNEHQNDIK